MATSRAYRRDLPQVREARQFVASEIESAGGAVTDDVLLVVSELVTNAVRHGGGDMEVRVAVGGSSACIAVLDDGGRVVAQPPESPPVDSVGGRGLYLVGALAQAWGSGLDDEGRTLVWAQLPLGRAAG